MQVPNKETGNKTHWIDVGIIGEAFITGHSAENVWIPKRVHTLVDHHSMGGSGKTDRYLYIRSEKHFVLKYEFRIKKAKSKDENDKGQNDLQPERKIVQLERT
jgi:hypothetical protein